MKNYKLTHKRSWIFFLLISLLIVGCCLLINVYRPVGHYTVYKIEPNKGKEKITTARSLDAAQKIMKENAIPSKKVNTFVENDEGTRVSITYGVVNIKHNSRPENTLEYYFDYKNRMQQISPALGSDGLYANTVMQNGHAEVSFQQSAAVAQTALENVEILNIFDDTEMASLSYYEVAEDKLYHHISADASSAGNTYTIPLGQTNKRLKDGIYYSWDEYHFYSNMVSLIKEKEENKKAYSSTRIKRSIPYNIPFLYTSLSQNTHYSANELDAYITTHLTEESPFTGTADAYFKAQEQYDINAIALFAIMLHENESIINESIIMDKAALLAKDCLNKKSDSYVGDFFGNKAVGMNVYYSNDPYWGEKVASIYTQINDTLGGKDSSLKISEEKDQ